MRLRVLAGSALALALLAGCGGDDDADDDGSVTTTEAPVEVDVDVQANLDTTLLGVEDLGEGWVLTDTEPAGSEEDDDEPSPLDVCVDDVDEQLDGARVAETEERTFERQGSGVIPVQLTSSSVALDDAGVFDEMHAVLRDETFGGCMAEAFQTLMSSTSPDGADISVGEITLNDTVVDPGGDEDVESTGIEIPLTISAEGLTIETIVTVVFINTGELGASLFVFGPVDEVTSEEIAGWGRVIGERLSAAA